MPASRVLGCWRVVRVVGDIVEGLDAEMEYRVSGDADHAVLLPDGWMLFRMKYRIEGDILVLEVHSPGNMPESGVAAETTWARVLLPNADSGWIRGASVYNPVGWRAMLVRRGERRLMIFFVAGD